MKKTLAAILALVMIMTVIPLNIFTVVAEAAEITAGTTIAFGSYPQTKVTDAALIAALNSGTPDAAENVVYEGAKYKKICFSEYNFGINHQLANGYLVNTTYWFKHEPLLWRVLSNTSGELFVLAENIIDAKVINADGTSVTWETSQLRAWLNNDFYNTAFSATESSKIITTNNINQGSSNTSDKLFLLSTSEANNSAYFSSAASRVAQGTDFSKCGGLQVQTSGTATGKSMWWLRNMSVTGKSSYAVTESGSTSGAYENAYTFIGVRPAYRINLTTSGLKTIAFDANGGTGGTSAVMNAGETLAAPTVTRTGYTLAGWLPSVPPTVPDADATYTAQWTINNYTLTFNADGGSAVAAITQNYNTIVEKPEDPVKTGYTFEGWYSDAGLTSAVLWPYTLTGSVTFHAKWMANAYNIIFDANGGTGSASPITQAYNTSIALPAAGFAKTGYDFIGWNTDPGAKTALFEFFVPAHDVVLYAVFNFQYPTDPALSAAIVLAEAANLPANAAHDPDYMAGGDKYILGDFTNGGFYARAMFTAESIDALEYAVAFAKSPYDLMVFPPIDKLQLLLNAYNNIALKSADYAQLNILIDMVVNLNRDLYTEDSLIMLDEVVMYAYDAVFEEYKLPLQAIVDDRADALQNALNAMEYMPADYSEVNYVWDGKPEPLTIYTDESVENLVTYYNEEIDWTLKADRQDVVDGYADDLIALINALVLDGADYTPVDNALKAIPDNDGGLIHVYFTYLYSTYTNSSVNNLAIAVNAVVRGLPGSEQPRVNAFAAAIRAATAALEPLDADYTYLSIALNNAPAWPASYYTSATYTPYTDALATGWELYNNQNLNITQQFIINDQITLIDQAYAALTLKDVTYTVKYQTVSGTTLAADVVMNATAADWVTETAVTVPGYTPVQATIQQRMTGTSTENIIIFTYMANPYTVTFDSNGGSAVAPITGQAGDPLTPPADPTRTGYLFSGWYVDSGLTAAVTWPYTIAGNITFYAKWTPTTTYKITFNSNGGSVVTAITQNANTAVAKPADPVKTGYTFKDWYLESSFSNAVIWPYTLAANITLYAKWTRNYYTVTFDAQGGTVDPVNRSIGYGYSYNPLPTPVKTDFVFMGWYTQPNGLGTRILGGDGVAIAQDHTIYAKWIPVTNVTVTLNAMGGTVSPDSVILTVGLPYGNLPVPTKAGYVFAGWYQSPPSYLSYDYVLSNFIVAKDFDHTLYAKWNTPRYNLSFDSNGGSGGVLLGYSLPAGTMVTISLFPYFTVNFNLPPGEDPIFVPQVMLELPTRPGYTFVGWSMWSFMMPAHDVTVSAIWSPNSSVNIAFDTDGGSAIAPVTGNPGDPFTAPADPTRAGYTFMGWSPSIPPSVPDDDVTYTAMWQANCYMITFNANGGTGGTSITLECGSPLTPPTVARTGFVFAGWSTMLPATVGAGDADYTALWRMVGDINGNDSITSADALMALQASAEIISPTEIQLSAADVNQSGTVTSADALKILQYSAGLITSF